MHLNTKARYAVMALLELVGQEKPVSLQTIAQKQNLSLDYLEQLFSKLKKKGLVIATRGVNGGYQLLKASHEIVLHDVFDAAQESTDLTRCKGAMSCMQNGQKCATHDLWTSMSCNLDSFLKKTSLQHIYESKSYALEETKA